MHEALLMGEEDHLKMPLLPLGRDTLTAKEAVLGAGEMGSVVQSISCFSRELGLDSQHQQNCSLLSGTSVPPFLPSTSGTCQARNVKQAKDPHMYWNGEMILSTNTVL